MTYINAGAFEKIKCLKRSREKPTHLRPLTKARKEGY
jgi:hypothetical protein